ncbi:hypothetical protein HJB61_05025 [Rhizobium lentis]|nr:hypothetical protein [Rhizobium lentis]
MRTRFSGGDIDGQADPDPQYRIDAFRIAAEAGRLVGAKHAAEKNVDRLPIMKSLPRPWNSRTTER